MLKTTISNIISIAKAKQSPFGKAGTITSDVKDKQVSLSVMAKHDQWYQWQASTSLSVMSKTSKNHWLFANYVKDKLEPSWVMSKES